MSQVCAYENEHRKKNSKNNNPVRSRKSACFVHDVCGVLMISDIAVLSSKMPVFLFPMFVIVPDDLLGPV